MVRWSLHPRRSAGVSDADPRFGADEHRPGSGLPHPHPSPAPKCGCGPRGPAILRGWRSALQRPPASPPFARAEVRVRDPRTRDSARMTIGPALRPRRSAGAGPADPRFAAD